MITINAVWIGFDADNNKSMSPDTAGPMFQAAENMFCIYFTMEVRSPQGTGSGQRS